MQSHPVDHDVALFVRSLSPGQVGRFVMSLDKGNALVFTAVYKRYQGDDDDEDDEAQDVSVQELLDRLTGMQLEGALSCLSAEQLTLFFDIYRRYRRGCDIGTTTSLQPGG